MNKSSGWGMLSALLGSNVQRGIPHVISTSLTFTTLDQELDAVFRFADSVGRFVWTHALASSDVANVAAGTDTTHGGALVQLANIGNRGSLDNGEFMPLGAIFGRDGQAGGAKALPLPFSIEGTTSIKLRVKNKVAGAQTLYFSLIGVKVDA